MKATNKNKRTAKGGKVRMKAWRGWCVLSTRGSHHSRVYPSASRAKYGRVVFMGDRIVRVEVRELPRKAVRK